MCVNTKYIGNCTLQNELDIAFGTILAHAMVRDEKVGREVFTVGWKIHMTGREYPGGSRQEEGGQKCRQRIVTIPLEHAPPPLGNAVVWNIFKEEVNDWATRKNSASNQGSKNEDPRIYFVGDAIVNAALNGSIKLQCHNIAEADGVS